MRESSKEREYEGDSKERERERERERENVTLYEKMKWERESLEEKCVSVYGLGRDRTKRRETLRV